MMLISNQAEIYIKEIKSTFLYLGLQGLILFAVQLYDRTRERKVEVFGLRSCKGENHPSILICGNEFSPPHFSSSWVVLFLGPNWWWSCNIRLLLTYSTKEMSCRQPDHKTAISEKQQNIKRLFFFLFVTSPKKVTEKKCRHWKSFGRLVQYIYLAFWSSLFPNRKQTHKLKWVSRTITQDK